MLRVYDLKHEFKGFLTENNYKDLKIEHTLSTGDKALSFTYLSDECDVMPEWYLQTEDDEYVVRERESSPNQIEYSAVLNLEGLESKIWATFDVTEITLREAAELALDGTGWTVGDCDIDKVRAAGVQNATSLEVIDKLCTVWMCERVYDTFNKTVSFYEKVGEDKGVYFLKGLNLQKLEVTQNSTEYYTQIFPYGADGLTIESVNEGKAYLENYQYSDKVRPIIWEDTSYTDPQALMDDAILKLDDMSKPTVSYKADIVDLASQSSTYSILSYGIGDTVTITDATAGVMDKQRIVKITSYPQNPEKNECEMANTTMTFEELHQQLQDAADIINNVTSSDGTVNGYYVFWNGENIEVTIQNSDAVQDIIRRLEALGG